MLLAESLLLGQDLLAWLVLALGGAMAVGNALALARPPGKTTEGRLERPPVGRTILMIAIGLIAAIWALASLGAG